MVDVLVHHISLSGCLSGVATIVSVAHFQDALALQVSSEHRSGSPLKVMEKKGDGKIALVTFKKEKKGPRARQRAR